MTNTQSFATEADLEMLQQQGITAQEANRQWAMLRERPQRVVLDRPCTVGQGIQQLTSSDCDTLIGVHRGSAQQGRWLKFVPASGAASRMFSFRSDEDRLRFCELMDRFAFVVELQRKLSEQGRELPDLPDAGRCGEVIDAVLTSDGLGYAQLPKALVPFHRYQQRTRTPFEEHILEGLACLSNGDGAFAAHFTVAPEHQARFTAQLQQLQAQLNSSSCRVGFSVQHPSTDTIAMDAADRLLRTDDGRPLLRPGGHGALLKNLNELQGDLIFVKNIDNVGHQRTQMASVRWIQILGGYLVRLQAAVHQHVRSLQAGGAAPLAAARDFVQRTFSCSKLAATEEPDSLRNALISQLKRPLRVCGMVPNEGEPGGGPFWVRQADGSISPQIVEAAEVDSEDAQQQAVLRQSTHFNPVFMALAVRDEQGQAFDLQQFVDDQRVIITSKSADEQTATVLERPGLWNGAMAKWNSVFVEVPQDVFSPVKTVFDLLRDQHQPPGPKRETGTPAQH